MRTLIFLLLFIEVCNSQTSCFDLILSGYNVSSVTDDSQFIWAGTFNNGLISINKMTNVIQTYTIANSTISSNSIKSVLNIDGRLYLSTDVSLMQLSNGNFIEISTTIKGAITSTNDGYLAVAAPFEFNILDANNQITYSKDLLTLAPLSCCGSSTYIEYDDNGKLWLSNYGFYKYDILTYDSVNWNVYNISNSVLPIESFTFLNGITTHNNRAFASNWEGLFKFENNTWFNEHSQNNPSIFNDIDNIEGLIVNAIKYDSKDILWIGAGEYENAGNGKIAFKTEGNWEFLDSNSQILPGINFFEESQNDSDIIYAASNNGLLIINSNCALLTIEDSQQESNDISIFPNPTSGILNINSKHNKPFSVEIINSLGQIVFSKTDISNNYIDLSILASGFYNLLIVFENSIVNKKILKFNE